MIKYEPSKLLSKVAPKTKVKKLVGARVSLKQSALSFVNSIDFLTKGSVKKVALRTIKDYKKRIEEDPDQKKVIKKDPKQLVQRVQNQVVQTVSKEIAKKYRGEKYKWLPSDAAEPDPQHQLKYGKIYTVGVGEMPGDRYGCRCGMQILVEDSSLDI